jgi:hypothetical protein
MPAAEECEKCLRRFLTRRGGSAPAGEATAHAIAEGHSASTVHRAAGLLVRMVREGNAFLWVLPAFAPDSDIDVDAPRVVLDSRYAPMTHVTLLREVAGRRSLEPWASNPELTEAEAICLLEADDAGDVRIPAPAAVRGPLPY